ncbi:MULTISPECIES: citramalate synthase [Paenibacillus]|uniref:Citramalate synthase n=1 Tax=Paenibacillus naphthalenovorans TaxID=162209 RepID=A0A0U2UGK8_9BACL|nr:MULTISPECIES: citramalate synthase [Paenibacillus]ALS21025.1 citramalate synthase [Paenibacillus naphthalenovorans]GCL71060.1 citramalate synthase [Paenibacillus naphthalenovorans]SDI61879.1 2-isopropylmalate synthase [Paenibacillus naphthalenovorans]
MGAKIKIFDTTLRDGTQGEGISLSVEDKLKIAQKLDELGVSYIEGGWPGSNNKDIEFFIRVKELGLKQAKVTAFGSTRRKDTLPENDANLNRILEVGVQAAAIFGKSWDFQVHTAIQTTLEENLAMIYDSVRYLKSRGLEIIYDAEHFFDGYKSNPEYALATIKKAEEAGADWIALCDTNGGTLPHEISEIVAAVRRAVKCPIGIHAHNDCEVGVANSIAAVMAGATQVQGTINGYGERCGNANLVSIIPNLQLKLKYDVISDEQLANLTNVARYVSEIANMHMPMNQPYVGTAAFAHKGGIHVSAILRNSSTYEHITPELVGNKQRVLVSELAGQSNLVFKAQELGLDFNTNNQQTKQLIAQIKEMEHQGYQFEGADATLELLIRGAYGHLEEVFTLESFKIMVAKSEDQPVVSEAIVKVKVHGETVYNAAEGNGPVNALDNALRKCLMQYYPGLQNMHLTDYKVRVLDEKDTTAAKVRVLIESSDFQSTWSTVGVSENVIEASWQALVDSMRYALLSQTRAARQLKEQQREQVGLINH